MLTDVEMAKQVAQRLRTSCSGNGAEKFCRAIKDPSPVGELMARKDFMVVASPALKCGAALCRLGAATSQRARTLWVFNLHLCFN